MTSRTRLALAVPLLLIAPALAACGGSANAAHDACMGEAASQAAAIDGVDSSTYEGDYDLMSLCDTLVGEYPDDEGRVLHVVGCIGDYVDRMSRPDAPIEWAGDPSAASKMSDPMSVGV